MSTVPVDLDFSTFKPLPPAQSGGDGGDLDFSTFKPIAAPKPTPVAPQAAPRPAVLPADNRFLPGGQYKPSTPSIIPAPATPAIISPQEAADAPNQEPAKPAGPSASAVPTDNATVSASSPSLVQRGMNVLRNSPLGHAFHLETTRSGTPEYEAEKQQFRPEQLLEGLTQEQAERVMRFVAPFSHAIPPGTFRATPASPATPAEERGVGALKAAGELASAPSIASQVGIAAATGGLGEILAAPLVPAVAGKVVHSLIGAGFTAQMAASTVDDIKAWQEAHARGDERAANEAIGHMTLSGAMTILAGLGTAHEARGAVREAKAAAPPPEEKPVLHATNDVEALRASAERQAEPLGDAAKAATEGVPGAKLAAVRDSKDTDRIEDKAARQDIEPSQIGDIAAAKIVVPDQAAADKVLENLHQQMPVEKVEGSVTGDPAKNAVRQVQATVNLGNPGEPVKKAEVLIQTPEMHEATADTHDDYRRAQELRAAGKEDEAKAIEAQISARHEEAEKAAQARLAGTPPAGKGGRGQSPEPEPPGVAPVAPDSANEGEPKYKYASTQHNIADESEAGQAITAARGKIADADVAGDGKDIDGNHVTVRYGLQHELTPELRAFIESQAPFDATLGPTESFKPSEQSDGAAPIIAPINSPELQHLNGEIEKHGDFAKSDFPDYKPHATVAYVKPEAAERYTGDQSTAGKKFRVDSIAVTDRNGNATEVPLKGAAEPEKQGRAVLSDSDEQTQLGNPPPPSATADKVERVPVAQIQLDPKRFQYKMDTDRAGVTNLLKGRKWNEDLAGRINVWRDPDDDKLYVVNGHHRFQLAQENGVPDVKVDYIKAQTAQEARAVGALQNIAEGRGTAMDAAKFFRDSGYTPDKLDSLGISMGEATAANGVALSKLDPSIFDQVVSGKLRQGRAIAIGNATADPADQEALLKLIQKAETRGKRVTDDVVDELARMVKGSTQHTETQTNLFGAQEMTRNLALEKADISSYIREKLGAERRTFQSVADQGKAATLGKVKGQTLKPEQNAKIAQQAQMAQELYDRVSTRAGTIDDILNRSAKELAEGGKPNDVRQRAYDDIRRELSTSLTGATGENDRGVQAPAQKERPASAAPIPPKREGAGATAERGAAGATGQTELKAPAPPATVKSNFTEGRQTTPIEVRDAQGNWRRGTLDFYTGLFEPHRGRVTLEDGTKMNNVPDRAMRPAAVARPIAIANKEVKPVTHSPGEADVIERTKANAEKMVADYIERNTEDGVPTVATDAAKELYPEFKADAVNADRDVAAGAKAVRNWALEHLLSQPVDPKRPDVLITTASPGSGKTTGQRFGGNQDGIGMKIEAISDSDKGFNKIIQQVIDSGRRPVIEWVYVDEPGKTVERMFRRAIGHDGAPGIGRTVQLDYMKEAYHEVPRVIERAIAKFGDQVDFRVIDNSGPKDAEKPVSDDLGPYLEKAKQKSYNEIKEAMDAQVEQLRGQGLFDSDRGRDSLKAANASDKGPAQNQPGARPVEQPKQPQGDAAGVGQGDRGLQKGSESPGSVLTPEKQLEQERGENEGRATARKDARGAAAARTLEENAAQHKSEVVDFNGRKAIALDADGEGIWHRVFKKIKPVGGQNPLGAGESWRGMQLDRTGVNIATAYIKGAIEDLHAAGIDNPKAEAGLERFAKMLKDARNESGGTFVLRGDYRADTAREEAWHQWQVENDLHKSDAMSEIASMPEFKGAVDKLKDLGYKDASARTLAMETMAKATAGDLDLSITDEQRRDLVRSFLTKAVEEKGPGILDRLPEVDPRVRDVVDDVRRDYGKQSGRGNEEGAKQAAREQVGQTGQPGGEPVAGTRAPDRERPGQRPDARGGEAVPEERPSKSELEAAGQSPLFQKKAPRPVRPEDSFALPGMEKADEERQLAAGEEQARQLTEAMRAPGKNISGAAGRMERESPLFAGTEASGMSGLFDVLTPEEKQATLFQRADPDEKFSDWFRKMVDLKQQYHEDTLKPQREKFEAAREKLGEDATPASVAAAMGAVVPKFEETPNNEADIRNFGEPKSQMENRAKFEDWARAKGIKIPEMPKQRTMGSLFDSDGNNPAMFQRDVRPEVGAIHVGQPQESDEGDGWKSFYASRLTQDSPAEVRRIWGYDKEGMAEPHWRQAAHMLVSPEKDGSMAVRLVKSLDESKGAATALYRNAIEYAKQQGATELTSDPEGGSKDAVAGIWKKLGAVETPGVGEKPGQVRWRLDLTKPVDKTAAPAAEGMTLFQKAAKDTEGPVARSVADLVDEMKAVPAKSKGTMLDRVADWTKDTIDESVGRSQKAIERVPDAFEKAFAWSKATTAALVHDYLHPLQQTDWKTAAGQMQLSEAETAQRLFALAAQIKEKAPKLLDRIAISHYMEAAGDERKLRTWALGAKELALKSQGDPLLTRARKSYLRDAVEHYEQATKLTPDQQALAHRLRQHFDDMLDVAQKNGVIDYGYRNYVMHIYDKEEAARLLNEVDTNELNPTPGFTKKRFYDTLFTAEQNGMTPRSKDIGHLLTAYDKSLNQAIASRGFMRSLLDAKAPDGRPIAAIRARNGWVTVDDDKKVEVLSQRKRPATLDGYEFIDRPQLRNFLFKPTTEDLEGYDPKLFEEDPDSIAFKGDLMIHPKYVGQVTDMLTPSWFERGETWPQKIGKGLQTVSGAAKELMTAAAPFHMVQLGVHGLEHMVNPLKLPDLDLSGKSEDSKIQRLLASHGLSLVNYDAEGLFSTRAMHGIAEHVPFVNKAMDSLQAFSHWQFQDYIPRLKMQMALDAFKRNTKDYGSKLSPEQIAELTSKESNAAFGNLNTMFDTVPRTKTFKSLLKLAAFAPDFLESRARFVGQAFTRYGGEQRAALIRGALVMYAAARIGNALLNNGDAKWDPGHAFSLVVNGKDYAMRTVQGDLLHAVEDPRGFIYNRLNPLTTRPAVEFLSGRDQAGRQKTAVSQVKDITKSVLPFGAQKVIQTPDESLLNSILTSAGVNASNDRTPTEEEVHKLYLGKIPDSPEDDEKQAESRKLRQMEDKVRQGSMTPSEVWAHVDKGDITAREAGRTVERGQQSRLAIEFKALGLKDAVKVYEKLQAESKEPKIYPYVALELSELRPEMEYKASHGIADLPEADREAMANKLDSLLSEATPQQ